MSIFMKIDFGKWKMSENFNFFLRFRPFPTLFILVVHIEGLVCILKRSLLSWDGAGWPSRGPDRTAPSLLLSLTKCNTLLMVNRYLESCNENGDGMLVTE